MKLERWISPRTCVTVEGSEHLAIFKALTAAQEAFGERACGKCQSEDIEYVVREATDKKGKEEYEYPEMHCKNPKCRAKLTYGQAKDKTFFPIRFKRTGKEYDKDENGKLIPKGTNGWVKWNFDTKQEE